MIIGIDTMSSAAGKGMVVDMAAIRMPATPEVFSFGVQATFNIGEFIIGVGASIAPIPFQNRHHSKYSYR